MGHLAQGAGRSHWLPPPLTGRRRPGFCSPVACASGTQRHPFASLQDTHDKADEEFAIVFAAMGVNMETAHYFKQVGVSAMACQDLIRGTCAATAR